VSNVAAEAALGVVGRRTKRHGATAGENSVSRHHVDDRDSDNFQPVNEGDVIACDLSRLEKVCGLGIRPRSLPGVSRNSLQRSELQFV
jgi:hypothetical protein